MTLPDVQALPDSRGLSLDAVGVTGLRYPVTVWDQAHAKQNTVAEISMSVALPAEVKGTHISRFFKILDELTPATLPVVLRDMHRRLAASDAQITASFPYFPPRSAPVTGATALMDYACRIRARPAGGALEFAMRVAVPVTSACPCSKAISDCGAHNQRGLTTIEVTPRCRDGEISAIWIEDLVAVAEACASSPVYPLLERPDERHVTMTAYDTPVFVEDMAREAARRLQGGDRIAAFARISHPASPPPPGAGRPW